MEKEKQNKMADDQQSRGMGDKSGREIAWKRILKEWGRLLLRKQRKFPKSKEELMEKHATENPGFFLFNTQK